MSVLLFSSIVSEDGPLCMVIDVSNKNQFDSLKELNKVLPITKIILTGITSENFEHALNFVKTSPNITHLSLTGKLKDDNKIEDQHLNKLSQNLPKLNTFSIADANITAIPKSIIDNAENLNCSHCNNLETINTNAKNVKISYCNNLSTLIADGAEYVETRFCSNLKSITADSAKEIKFWNNPILANLSANNAEKINFNGCFDLETINANSLKKLDLKGFTHLKSLIAKIADIHNLTSNPYLETIDAPDRTIIDLIEQDFPQLKFTEIQKELRRKHQALIELFKTYAIDPASYKLGARIEIPEVPKLKLQAGPDDNVKTANALIDKLNEIVEGTDPQIEIRLGGENYSKEGLQRGMIWLKQKLASDTIPEESKNRIYSFIVELAPKWLDENNKIEGLNSLIRLLVSSLKSGNTLDSVEENLQLLYCIDQLYTSFMKINTSEPDKEGYIDPNTIVDVRKVSIEELETSLINLFRNVKGQKGYSGTPLESDPEQLQLYYNNLEKYLQHIAINIGNIEDTEEKNKPLIDLAIAARHCGERWIGDAEQIYELSLPDEERKGISFADIIHNHDSNLRTGIVEEMTEGDRDVHLYNKYKRLLGRKFGLRGGGAVAEIEDRLFDNYKDITKEKAEADFLNRYTLKRVVEYHSDYLNTLYRRFNTRDLTISFLMDMIPDEWDTKENRYSMLRDTVSRFEAEGRSRIEIRNFLRENGISCRPDWSAQTVVDSHIQNIKREMDDKIAESDLKIEDEQRKEIAERQISRYYGLKIAEAEKLLKDIKDLPVDKQKNSLQMAKIEIGNGTNPNYLNEIEKERKNEYLDTLFEKDESNTPIKLTLDAVLQVLQTVGKIQPINPQ